ncbi:MAG: metallophosphoesterase family protein [Desulfobacterales bacterium]
MRLAIFSDIHSNMDALEAVIADAAQFRIDRYICLGDIVGYGPNPNLCVRRIISLPNLECVVGNHDEIARHEGPVYNMNKEAARAIQWTRRRLSEESRAFLRSLGPVLKKEHMIFAHGAPWAPMEWKYVMNTDQARRAFSRTQEKILFIGHSHVPQMISRGKLRIRFESPEERSLMYAGGSDRIIVNCGSVGQPRDGNPTASYVIYDTERKTVLFRRVPYDIGRAAEKIIAAGLPEFLAARLFEGV